MELIARVRKTGKKIYSPWSEPLIRSAVRQSGRLAVKTISQSPEELVIRLKNGSSNGDLYLDRYDQITPMTDDNEDEDWMDVPSANVLWSSDKKEWQKLPKPSKALRLKAGEKIYLKLTPKNISGVETIDLSETTWLYADSVTYNRLPSKMYLHLSEGSGSAFMNMEMIH